MKTLDLKLTPPSPLGARQALIVVGGSGIFLALAGLRFAALGAWPVLPFLLIDLALLVWAFRACARASHAYESLRIEGCRLVVNRVAASGAVQSYTLESRLTRVELEQLSPPENRLWLLGQGRKLAIGRFLSPRERQDVYDVLRRELAR